MKVKIKSEKVLRKIFKDEGYYRGDMNDGWLSSDSTTYFNDSMFKYCGMVILVEQICDSDYDYESEVGKNWSWMKEWTVQMSEFHMKEFDV